MIDQSTMEAQATLKVQNAPNQDWRNRGKVILVGDLREIPITNWDKKVFGNATVGFFKFEKPQKDEMDKQFPFIGFTLAVAKIGKKLISETHPVCGKLKEEDYNHNRLSTRFCPDCGGLDTVKQRSRRAGPECIYITYYCKCGYEDHDCMD